MILHLHLVRHGQTYFNRYNRLQGWCDSPLTDSGLADAKKAAAKLQDVPLKAAYCSDTMRAVRTARMILAGNHAQETVSDVIADKGFREQFYGYYEACDMGTAWYAAGAPHGTPTYAQIVAKYGPAATRDFLKAADPFHDAESDEEYWARIRSGYELIARQAREGSSLFGPLHDGDHVLQISHGNTLRGLVRRFAPKDADFDLSRRPANGSVTTFDFDTEADFDQCLTVVSYNQ